MSSSPLENGNLIADTVMRKMMSARLLCETHANRRKIQRKGMDFMEISCFILAKEFFFYPKMDYESSPSLRVKTFFALDTFKQQCNLVQWFASGGSRPGVDGVVTCGAPVV